MVDLRKMTTFQFSVKMTNEIAKRPVGRPTKYIPEVIYPKITAYIESTGKSNGEEQTELPTLEGLALALGVNPDTIYEWASGKYSDKYKIKKLRGRLKHPEFSESLKQILAKQKNQLMNDGMYGGKEINQAMAIFLLKANHGLSDGTGTVQVNIFGNAVKKSDEFVEAEEV